MAWNNKGSTLCSLNRQEEALQAFDTAILLNPNDSMAWSNKGMALSSLGRHDEALQAYDKAILLTSKYRAVDSAGQDSIS